MYFRENLLTDTMEKENAAAPARAGLSTWIKRVLLLLLMMLAVLQLFQPDKENQSMDMSKDISTVVEVPDSVHTLLKTACYDCHSNFTRYPWYSNIQPLGWWLKDHIEEGKEHLNFQEFAALTPRPNGRFKTAAALQDHKLEEVAEQVESGEMPLKSYTLIHGDAQISAAQRNMLIKWVGDARRQLEKQATENRKEAE